jgi:hypothetical protein
MSPNPTLLLLLNSSKGNDFLAPKEVAYILCFVCACIMQYTPLSLLSSKVMPGNGTSQEVTFYGGWLAETAEECIIWAKEQKADK